MRDTSGLRTKIALLACLPGLAATSTACSPPAKPQPVDDGEARRGHKARKGIKRATHIVPPDRQEKIVSDNKRLKYYQEKAKAEGKTLEEVVPSTQLEDLLQQKLRNERKAEVDKIAAKARGELPKPEPKPQAAPLQHEPPSGQYGLFPGDPPFIDGYNPEEEHCVTGNWCGTGEAAAEVAIPHVPVTMRCSSRIGGGKASEIIEADPKTYASLSTKPNMQGTLNEHGTELSRAKSGDDSMCCYHWFEYCSGRPHLGEHGPVLAAVETGDAWNHPELAEATHEADVEALPQELRALIAQQWLEDARAEHASIAAFARATLELMAVGAPPALLADVQAAGLDEIDHARRCFALANRYGGGAVQAGPLRALAPREADLARLAADTFAEGCVGETIAALAVQRAARRCADPQITESLERIASDESRHAALAWSTIAWALRTGGEEVAQRLRRSASSLRVAEHVPPADPYAKTLAAHGRLDARGQAMAAREAWSEIIDPMLESLLAETRHEVASTPLA